MIKSEGILLPNFCLFTTCCSWLVLSYFSGKSFKCDSS